MADEKKVALITGASSGVGRRLAIEMAGRGYDLVLAARSEDELKKTAEQAEEEGDIETLVRPTDVSKEDEVEGLIADTKEKFGRLDILANVAGKAQLKPIEKVSSDDWRTMVDVNLSPVVHTTRLAWPMFKEQESGFVANVSSMASKDPFPGFAVYATVKCGVNMWTLMTGREGKKIGVKAVCIAPGAIETDMLRGMFDKDKIPEDEALAPEEVAKLIADCATGEREFESGQTLFVSK